MEDLQRVYDTIANYETLSGVDKRQLLLLLGKKECNTCNNLCEIPESCEFCIRNFLVKNFDKWTSGSDEIDKLIKERQKNINKIDRIVEWIQFDKFNGVQFVFFARRHKAKWSEGKYKNWDSDAQKLTRFGSHSVNLKRISAKDHETLLQKIKAHLSLSSNISPVLLCYGITKDEGGDYHIVTENVENNLRSFLIDNVTTLTWIRKFEILLDIAISLKSIHAKRLIHGELRSDMVMRSKRNSCWLIGDLGLCKPADKQSNGSPTTEFPNLEYAAPEILKNEAMTMSSDVYSFAMIMSEVASGFRPYEFKRYRQEDIINGLRPDIVPEAPTQFLDLMKKCWDLDLSKRPTITSIQDEIQCILNEYRDDVMPKEEIKKWEEKNCLNVNIHGPSITEDELKSNQGNINKPVPIIKHDQISELKEIESDSIYSATYTYEEENSVKKVVKVAVKRLEIEINDENKSLLREKISERRVIYDHPKIVEFLGIHTSQDEKKLFLVMPFADNDNLRNYLVKNSTLSFKVKVKIAIDITSGIKVLHDNNIVHQNLNPTNILIFKDGTAKISNLPLPYNNSANKEIYLTEYLIKNIGYIDPNSFLNKTDIEDKAIDIYSLGSLLWEIVSGRVPYSTEDDELLSLILKIRDKYHRESDIPEVDPEYTNLYKKCWSSKNSERPKIEEVNEILRKL